MTDAVPQASKREQIAEALLTRAQAITRLNGFNTDAGKTLVLGERIQLGEDDPDSALQLLVGDDERATWQSGKLFYRIPYRFTAISRAGREDSWRDAERLLQDVKRAMELVAPDTLDGLLDHPGLERSPARTLEREAGAVDVGIEVTYWAPLAETWGNP